MAWCSFKVTGSRKSNCVVELHEATQMFIVVDYVREMIVKKPCMTIIDRFEHLSSCYICTGSGVFLRVESPLVVIWFSLLPYFCLSDVQVNHAFEPARNQTGLHIYEKPWAKIWEAQARMKTSAEIMVFSATPIREWETNGIIFTDSLSALQALNSADLDQMMQGLLFFLAKPTAQFSISLQWVPAHVGLTGNEREDRLEQIGSQARQT